MADRETFTVERDVRWLEDIAGAAIDDLNDLLRDMRTKWVATR